MKKIDPLYGDQLVKFNLDALAVHEIDGWMVSVRPKQITLGSMVLIPRRYTPSFAQLAESRRASAGLFAATAACEQALNNLYHPDRVNLIAAMMKDPFVHFHLIPRYSQPMNHFGLEWIDADWPALVSFGAGADNTEVQALIQQDLAGALQALK